MRWVVSAGALILIAFLLGVREESIARAPALPMSFAHQDHMEVGCATCHHNFLDDTGQGLCIDCHKTDPEIAADIEEMFHDLCRDCHVERQREGLEGGPTRACFACHEGDDLP